MSSEAIAQRLSEAAELNELGLSLAQAKPIRPPSGQTRSDAVHEDRPSFVDGKFTPGKQPLLALGRRSRALSIVSASRVVASRMWNKHPRIGRPRRGCWVCSDRHVACPTIYSWIASTSSMHRIFEVAPRPRGPVTAQLIDPDVSRPINTGPGNSGKFPQAISAALCSAVLIFCGTRSSAFKYAANCWYGNCFERRISDSSAIRSAT